MEAIAMKPGSVLAAALVALMNLPVMAQQADAAGQQSAAAAPGVTASAAGKPLNPLGAAVDRGPLNAALRPPRLLPVHAQLMGSLDSKSAKTGSAVELRTQEPMKTADGTEIPKGTKIMGHVISVEAHGKGSENARMVVEFDRAELKGGQSFAIKSSILSVTPPPDPSTSSMLRSMDNMGGGVMGGATQVAGGARTGGLGAGNSSGMTVSGGMLQATPKQTEGLGSIADYGVQAPTQAAPPAAAGGNGVVTVGPAHAETAHATGVSGVMLASDATFKVSGTFSAVKQNVHLEGGTRVVLGLVILQ
jgi:hypothetical protein